jgi:2-oxoglutarate ferredoxin oxidoreductase subunit gamma
MALEFQLAGFGGQGVMVLGQILCYAGIDEGKHVSWFPSYGAEMRGGTANCAVVVSDEEIGSPVIGKPDVVVAMNNPSLLKFESAVKPGGLLFINSTLVDREPSRTDIKIIKVPANQIAMDLGNARIANMVMLGAMLELTKTVAPESAKNALKEHLPERHHRLLPVNYAGIDKGAEVARAQA